MCQLGSKGIRELEPEVLDFCFLIFHLGLPPTSKRRDFLVLRITFVNFSTL